MYENEDDGEILEEDLAVVLEIMLGVKDVDLSGLFLALGRPDTRKITYGKSLFLFLSWLVCEHFFCLQDHFTNETM